MMGKNIFVAVAACGVTLSSSFADGEELYAFEVLHLEKAVGPGPRLDPARAILLGPCVAPPSLILSTLAISFTASFAPIVTPYSYPISIDSIALPSFTLRPTALLPLRRTLNAQLALVRPPDLLLSYSLPSLIFARYVVYASPPWALCCAPLADPLYSLYLVHCLARPHDHSTLDRLDLDLDPPPAVLYRSAPAQTSAQRPGTACVDCCFYVDQAITQDSD